MPKKIMCSLGSNVVAFNRPIKICIVTLNTLSHGINKLGFEHFSPFAALLLTSTL